VESEAKTYSAFSASLRILSEIPDLNKIMKQLGVQLTRTHRKGDKAGPGSWGYPNDIWNYQVPLDEVELLEKHIVVLWDKSGNVYRILDSIWNLDHNHIERG
jgi:hypothetical protein